MTTLPVADGARMLGIHPKTLHHWLTQAQMPSYPHPGDARLKCLTLQHLQQLASMHARPLQFSAIAEPVLSEGVSAYASSETDLLPASLAPEADLIQKLSHGWFAYRRINGHQYVHALGSPHELTIARFEQMAATLQSFVTTS